MDWPTSELSHGKEPITMLPGRTDTEDASSERVERCALGPGLLVHPVHGRDLDHHGQEYL